MSVAGGVPMMWVMRNIIAGLAAVASVTIASRAHAVEPHYGLAEGNLVITIGDETENVAIDCAHAYALAKSGANLYVACGEEGVVTYALGDPRKPALAGRVLPSNGACVWLTPDGGCLTTHPMIVERAPFVLAEDVPPPPKKVRFNDALFVGGLVSIAAGSVMTMVGITEAFSSCVIMCSSSESQASAAWGGVALAGLATAVVVGIPLAVIGGHHVTRVTASVGPTGGALRVAF